MESVMRCISFAFVFHRVVFILWTLKFGDIQHPEMYTTFQIIIVVFSTVYLYKDRYIFYVYDWDILDTTYFLSSNWCLMTQKNKIIFEYSKCDILYKLYKTSAICCKCNKNIFNTVSRRKDQNVTNFQRCQHFKCSWILFGITVRNAFQSTTMPNISLVTQWNSQFRIDVLRILIKKTMGAC